MVLIDSDEAGREMLTFRGGMTAADVSEGADDGQFPVALFAPLMEVSVPL